MQDKTPEAETKADTQLYADSAQYSAAVAAVYCIYDMANPAYKHDGLNSAHSII
jgi:hypothetical protein